MTTGIAIMIAGTPETAATMTVGAAVQTVGVTAIGTMTGTAMATGKQAARAAGVADPPNKAVTNERTGW